MLVEQRVWIHTPAPATTNLIFLDRQTSHYAEPRISPLSCRGNRMARWTRLTACDVLNRFLVGSDTAPSSFSIMPQSRSIQASHGPACLCFSIRGGPNEMICVWGRGEGAGCGGQTGWPSSGHRFSPTNTTPVRAMAWGQFLGFLRDMILIQAGCGTPVDQAQMGFVLAGLGIMT